MDESSDDFKQFEECNNNFKPFFIPLWNKYSISFINFIYLKLNYLTIPEKKEDFLSVIFPFYKKENYFNFFGKKGFIESQLLIHESKFDSFMLEFKNLFKKYEPTITLFSLKNMSGQQKLLRFEDNKICITFDYVNNSKNLLFMSKIDSLYEKYEILPSIIKDSRITKEIFNKSYKNSSVFIKKLREFDKERIYQSEISRRLGNMTYLIIGASSGLGRELAILFAKKNCNLIIVSRDERDLIAIKSDLEIKYKINVNFIALDFSSIDEIDKKLFSKKNLLEEIQGVLFPVGTMFEEDNTMLNAMSMNKLLNSNYISIVYTIQRLRKCLVNNEKFYNSWLWFSF